MVHGEEDGSRPNALAGVIPSIQAVSTLFHN